MSLLPFLERTLGYFIGIALWCLVLGPDNRLDSDLVFSGSATLAAILLCALVAISLHRRGQREAARDGFCPTDAKSAGDVLPCGGNER
ncbi:MAG TPA: hypothetical protein DCY89_03320 [Gammaproteobacteria bacterium]|nr:hypothetical protein [Gammaproteobacteria bacterium]